MKFSTLVLSVLVAGGLGSAAIAQEPQHFSPQGKMPSKFTIEAQEQQRKILPYADKQDFEEAKRGFIAAPPYRKTMSDKGDVVQPWPRVQRLRERADLGVGQS